MVPLGDMREAIGHRGNQFVPPVTKNPAKWEFLAVFTVDSACFGHQTSGLKPKIAL